MKNNREATHNHKRAGSVVLLESTAELAKVMLHASGDEFWVRLSDLTQVGSMIEKNKARRKQPEKDRPNASPNSRYRIVRVA